MTMIPFYTADVFTDRLFGGNQLAVFPDARGMSPALMQQIAREFNFSESTFVLPPADPANTACVRIFTPAGELPFAGHPTIGTAHVLAATGVIPLDRGDVTIGLEQRVGRIEVRITATDGKPGFIRLTAAQRPEFGPPPPDRATCAKLLSLAVDDVLDGTWSPQAVSCGNWFLLVPLRGRDAVARARLATNVFASALGKYITDKVFFFAMDPENPAHDIHARMFAPGSGIAEDAATGSAAVCLAGYLATRSPKSDGHMRWIIEQGYKMGRPSILEIEADKIKGEVVAVHVGGRAVIATKGEMNLELDEKLSAGG